MVSVGISGLQSYADTSSTLLITYENKEARILLQGLAPRFDQEPRQEICRRGILELIEALSLWEQSGAPIIWHAV